MEKFSEFIKVVQSLRETRTLNERIDILNSTFETILQTDATTTVDDSLMSYWCNLLINKRWNLKSSLLTKLVYRIIGKDNTTTTEPTPATTLAEYVRSSGAFSLCENTDPDLVHVYKLIINLRFKSKLAQRQACLVELIGFSNSKSLEYLFALVAGELGVGIDEQYISLLQEPVRTAALSSLDYPVAIVPRPPTAVHPMMAAQMESLSVDWSKYLVQIKYNGERLLTVKNGDDVRFYQRNLNEFPSERLADMDRVIRDSVTATNCTLDGELVLVDVQSGRILPGIKKKKRCCQDNHYRQVNGKLVYIVFDCIFNVIDIRDRPLSERLSVLSEIIQLGDQLQIAQTVDNVTSEETMNVQIERLLVSKQHEGFVVKALDEPYIPKSRKWMKVKIDYYKKFTDTLDLAVVGADYAVNNNSGRFTAFYLAAKIEEDNAATTAKSYRVIAKVSTGLTTKDIDFLTDHVNTSFVVNTPTTHTRAICEFGTYKCDYVVAALSDALVFEIKFASITDNMGLRFARFARVRSDKSVDDIDSIQRVNSLKRARPFATDFWQHESEHKRRKKVGHGDTVN